MALYQQYPFAGSPVAGVPAIRRTTDGAIIPFDPNNADFIAYEAWIRAGNTPDPPVPPLNPDDNTWGADPFASLKGA